MPASLDTSAELLPFLSFLFFLFFLFFLGLPSVIKFLLCGEGMDEQANTRVQEGNRDEQANTRVQEGESAAPLELLRSQSSLPWPVGCPESAAPPLGGTASRQWHVIGSVK
jgi:hypothetical protein